jgi:hypothetical protein
MACEASICSRIIARQDAAEGWQGNDAMKSPVPRASTAREWAIRIALIVVSLTIALLVAEVISRFAFPISERRDNVALDGRLIKDFVEPGMVYRQVSNEYDALTTITDRGYRVPAVEGNPDIVFIGDSFTFGYGLGDDETFVNVYCSERKISCANLGVPGSGTLKEVERLEKYLMELKWHPREVRLIFFGMSGSFSAGNDFVDNYDRELHERQKAGGNVAVSGRPAGGMSERLIGLQSFLLRHSNLVRMAKFYAGPALKSMIVAEPGEKRMEVALQATAAALKRLDGLSRREGFEYRIILLVPVHDILRGTQGDTLAALNKVSPKPALPTAQLFADAPSDYYYAFDGHLNPRGARRVAEFLGTLDTGVQ